jgi:ribosomal protein S18 acetylase RimI-like enzyme
MYHIVLFTKTIDIYLDILINMDYNNISRENHGEMWDKTNFFYELEMKNELSFIITDVNNSIPFGFIICSRKNDFVHIHRLCIDNQHQNKGYGKILINHLINEANKFNLKNISLNVSINNNYAIIFYLKNNFVIENLNNNNLYMTYQIKYS